jgi:hypothetical protein
MPRDDETVELVLDVLGETDLGWSVSDGDDTVVWLPKSLVERIGDTSVFVLPGWLAKDRGFV